MAAAAEALSVENLDIPTSVLAPVRRSAAGALSPQRCGGGGSGGTKGEEMLKFNCVACLAWAVVAAIGTSTLAAQATMTIPEGLLTEGETITVEYSDPSKANETVVIEADDGGFPTATVVEVVIVLDENGEGTVLWRVPRWRAVSFNGPDVKEQTRFIKEETPIPSGTSLAVHQQHVSARDLALRAV